MICNNCVKYTIDVNFQYQNPGGGVYTCFAFVSQSAWIASCLNHTSECAKEHYLGNAYSHRTDSAKNVELWVMYLLLVEMFQTCWLAVWQSIVGDANSQHSKPEVTCTSSITMLTNRASLEKKTALK